MTANPLENLAELLRAVEFLHLTIADPDDDESEYVLALRRDNRRETFVAESLDLLLTRAARSERRKRCSRCGIEKAPGEFPKAQVRKDRPDGRHSHCKLCDRVRKKKYNRRRSRGRAGVEEGAPQTVEPPAPPTATVDGAGPLLVDGVAVTVDEGSNRDPMRDSGDGKRGARDDGTNGAAAG